MRSIGLEQVGRTNVGLTSPRDERDDVHQRLGGLPALERKVADFIQGQDVAVVRTLIRVGQILDPVVILPQLNS